jgi:hypothetical protein
LTALIYTVKCAFLYINLQQALDSSLDYIHVAEWWAHPDSKSLYMFFYNLFSRTYSKLGIAWMGVTNRNQMVSIPANLVHWGSCKTFITCVGTGIITYSSMSFKLVCNVKYVFFLGEIFFSIYKCKTIASKHSYINSMEMYCILFKLTMCQT